MRTRSLLVACVGLLTFAGCGDDDDNKVCDPAAQTGCAVGLWCEEVPGAQPGCFAPVVVQGKVFDLTAGTAIAGARVVGVDANGAPASTVSTTDATGAYEVLVPVPRTADGTPTPGGTVTLRADAAGYQTFPAGLRQPIPIDTSAPVKTEDRLVIESALTDVGLLALPAGAGTAAVHGKVGATPDHAGVLVVAESGGAGVTGIADRNGDYKIFNLPAGSTTVTAYARGVNYDPQTVTLAAGQDAVVNLALSSAAASVVEGTVAIVNAPGGSATSVILVVESTFDENLARGEVPPGLRAPDPGTAPSIGGAYQIAGVPAGRYVVLAAFENDALVRDPDTTIGGTSILHIEVAAGGTTTVEGFKVTEALAILGPGAAGPEEVTAAPTLRWQDDSSEDAYHVKVFDAFGASVWEVDEARHTGDDPAVAYGGPLEAGMYYQFRVTSIKDGGPISQSEDLKGVFFVAPAAP